MSSKSSTFSEFASRADATMLPQDGAEIYVTKHKQLSVRELMTILQTIVRKDPSMLDAPVFHVEFGSLTPSTTVEASDDTGIVISGH